MGRIIDADALKDYIVIHNVGCGCSDDYQKSFLESIDDQPTIRPVRKGKWIWVSSTYDRTPCEMRYMCSECHHETILHSNEASYPWEKFCPNCGCAMTKEGD